jgi:succinyl-diaminopimelate desuccinylase
MGSMADGFEARLVRSVEESQEELVGLVCDLIKAPSENPPGDQREVMGVIKDYLKAQGIPYEAPYLKPTQENILATVGPTDGPRSLILYGHTDTVPVGKPDLWSFPAFAGDVRDGFIRGRGATDMKAGTACCLLLTSLFHRLEIPLGGPLTFHANPDEENYLLDEKLLCRLLDEGRLRGTACIMAEPGGLGNIFVGDKGDLWVRLTARGRPAHGSCPMLGDSALEAALEAVDRIQRLVRGTVAMPEELLPLLPPSRRAARARAIGMGLPERASLAGRSLDRTTVTLGRITAGTMANVVPEACEAELALCVPPGASSTRLAEDIRQAVKGLTEVEVTALSEPNYTDPRDPVVASVAWASRRVLGRAAKPLLCPGTTDGQIFRPRGIPTLFYGPSDQGLAHARDERVSAEETVIAAKVLGLATLHYLGTSLAG